MPKTFLSLLVFISVFGGVSATAQNPPPKLLVHQARFANVKKGDLVEVGRQVITEKSNFISSTTFFGGSAVLSLHSWGVSKISMSPGSSVTLTSYGYCFGGGRTSQFDVSGETYFTTRPKTHRCTSTIVCMIGSKGCVELNSNVAFVPLKSGSTLVAVQEGKARGISRLTTETQVEIPSQYFSVSSQDGKFTPAKLMSSVITKKPYTRTLTRYMVPEGFSVQAGDLVSNQLVLPNGLTPALVTPFAPYQP